MKLSSMLSSMSSLNSTLQFPNLIFYLCFPFSYFKKWEYDRKERTNACFIYVRFKWRCVHPPPPEKWSSMSTKLLFKRYLKRIYQVLRLNLSALVPSRDFLLARPQTAFFYTSNPFSFSFFPSIHCLGKYHRFSTYH